MPIYLSPKMMDELAGGMREGYGAKVVGLSAALSALDALPHHIMAQCRRTVLKKAANIVARAARSHAPKGETGDFKKSIGSRIKTYQGGDYAMVIIGSRRGARWGYRSRISHLIESGWRITVGGRLARDRKTTKGRSRQAENTGRSVGVKPGWHPMEKAFSQTQGTVRETIINGIAQTIASLPPAPAGGGVPSWVRDAAAGGFVQSGSEDILSD